ncbi:hypothetical protein PYW07_006913 [Mythimna separata]|uniref:Uncharacterized protein n=1 Tax=Mythimna separata TaxID=271217 RepID=A0AAD7Z0S4_MYTSE|nr:hypothetical protein PYW07_006913 [Mythimna separata]
MSRSVAGFALLLYFSVVSGQQVPVIRLKGTPTDPSIAVDVISGGNYPDASFSIGYGGNNNENGDGGPGKDQGVNTGNGNNDRGQVYTSPPNTGQNEGGYINGENDIGSYGEPNNQNGANNYDIPLQDPEQKPTNPYDDNYNRAGNNTPVKNSASRLSLFSKIFNYLASWFY